ncbi:conserved hypothetical protein [Ricinus communis]|uniref:Uncharacterized protein n=1 Tax=Ricinus communis TaxID=3988 RepID=B9R7M2_RICCO|nr:conserved hypothetical protein [Ricinus communis]
MGHGWASPYPKWSDDGQHDLTIIAGITWRSWDLSSLIRDLSPGAGQANDRYIVLLLRPSISIF